MQIAPLALQLPVPGSRTDTSWCELGWIVIVQLTLLPDCRRRAWRTAPPSTSNASSRSVRKPTLGSSLNVSPTVNVRSPSCSAGTPSSSAVSGTVGGPATVTESEFDSRRPSSAQTASPCLQAALPPLTLTVTASLDDSATVTSHSALLPFTRATLRTAAVVAVTAWSRRFRYPTVTASLNTSRSVNVLSGPSCSAGACVNCAVNGSGSGSGSSVVAPSGPDHSPDPASLTARTR